MLASVLVGALTAVSTLLLLLAVEYAGLLVQGLLIGIRHPFPAGEELHALPGTLPSLRPWLVVLVPGVGAALGGALVLIGARDSKGHAIDATIRAVHQAYGRIPFRVPVVRAIAAVLTIGSGGAAGRIGPNAHLGSAFGSWIATRFRLSMREHRTLALAGCAAGIGAICRAPFGGALTAVEILYKDDFESSAVVPCVVSSITAYSLFMTLLALPFAGFHAPTICLYPDMGLDLGRHLPVYAGLALLCALAGRLFIITFQFFRKHVFPRIPDPAAPVLQCALGGLAVGCIGLFETGSMGGGFGYVQVALDLEPGSATTAMLQRAAGYFLALALLRILTTSLTIGSGSSGGLFGPALLIGGLLGAATGAAMHTLLPTASLPPLAGFVAVGMVGFFAAVANAPIGGLVLVSEMTGSYALFAPLMLVSMLSFMLLQRQSVYDNQRRHRAAD